MRPGRVASEERRTMRGDQGEPSRAGKWAGRTARGCGVALIILAAVVGLLAIAGLFQAAVQPMPSPSQAMYRPLLLQAGVLVLLGAVVFAALGWLLLRRRSGRDRGQD